ncbi:MAG: hypothetical protein AB7F22_07720 [Reyranella sp.]|uniref:hypothetical protein n=1 Tax=Reyranella sp. TaxID=1929291 RepID=UPI003D143EDB
MNPYGRPKTRRSATVQDIVAGTKLYNNDPRVPEEDRVITVNKIAGTVAKPLARYRTKSGRIAHISFHRIFMDQLPRHQGYNIVPPDAEKPYSADYQLVYPAA